MDISPRELEHMIEQYQRDVDAANRAVAALVKTIQQIEKAMAVADQYDLRSNISLKSDMRSLEAEVEELKRNIQFLERELADTSSKINKALF
jgi:polyhydroxyalkanoate synthesis regulator phasin